ncbi:MAG: serine/threonine-protein kinase [Gammaproteobacteria bacterium]|nr:serine/threonine-protein kinase [Gammaproteobacteria bacterium]
MKKGFLTADWFTGLIYTLLFFTAAYVLTLDFFQRLETAAYDFGVRVTSAAPSNRIAVIEIDEESIANIGRWPWPRNLHAELIDQLHQGGAKVIGTTVVFSEPQLDSGLLYIQDIADFFDNSTIGAYRAMAEEYRAALAPPEEPAIPEGDITTPQPLNDNQAQVQSQPVNPEPPTATTATAEEQAEQTPPEFPVPMELIADLDEVKARFDAASIELNTDARLAASLTQAGNVVVPMLFAVGYPIGRPDNNPPAYVMNNALLDIVDNSGGLGTPIPTISMTPPIPEIGENAAAIGHLILQPDIDGALRFEPLAIQYYDVFFPSFSLAVAARSLNLTPADIQVRLGEGVQLGGLQIDTNPDLLMYNYYYPDDAAQPAFQVDSFFDIFTGRVPVEKYRDKIVLIGATALGLGDSFATPVSPSMAPVMAVAHTISSILQEDFFTRPPWAELAELAIFLVLGLYVILMLPRLKAGMAALITLVLFGALFGAEIILLSSQNMWLQLVVPALFLITAHVVITVKLFRVTEKIKIRSEAEGAESNKMLALAFQGQGQLDMAFEKFRKCPMDDSLMDSLYNLALDYERKRQHNKAGAVYTYMAEYDAGFRDLQQRMKRSKVLEETVMLGGAGATTAGGTLLLDGDEIQKPMLGRYQVEKELGKGAMGVVYLGRDPKINRVVAIKTMALSQEFEADEVEEVKERFFREAETAGRLNHPSIVTIYDAGEEHDLAYIAMEFLKGKDLTKNVKTHNLLPAPAVFKLIADAADALDFAHAQNVVHRDIKPANMMYEADANKLKITDFGIARITDSSKTKTGMVLGTPSYMSPEQLSGKKVDGRSDLFSLGVTFYQLLTGQLPFQADSMATLMYKIANEEHGAVTVLRPDLPACIDAIINKALEKDVAKRYQVGAEFAKDVRACANNIS